MISSSIHVRARIRAAIFAGMGVLWLSVPGFSAPQDTPSAPTKAAQNTIKQAPNPLPVPAQFVLQNGMHVVVVPDARAPVISHLLAFRSGAADDPATISGVASFLADMMAKGTSDRPGMSDDSYVRTIARDGGLTHSETTQDYTLFRVDIGKARLKDVMALEADRMAHLSFGGDKMDTTAEQILAERRSTIRNAPDALAEEQARAALYLTHPYGKPVIGWAGDIRHITRADVVNFYKRHYAPNNAILVVVGDVTPDAVRTMAEEEYGTLPRQRLVRRSEYTMPPRFGPTRLSIRLPSVRVPEILRIYRVASFANAAPGGAEALQLAATILNRTLPRSLSRLAGKVSVRYDGYASDAGEFRIFARPRPGIAPARLEAALDTAINRFLRRPPTVATLNAAKKQQAETRLLRHDAPQNVAEDFARALAIGLTLQDVTEEPARIRALSAADLHQVTRKALVDAHSVTVTLAPEP